MKSLLLNTKLGFLIIIMKHLFLILFLLVTCGLSAQTQPQYPIAADAPGLEFAFELKVNIAAPFSVGPTSHGERVVIPITGGTFEGPLIHGTILNGGADYQLVDKGRNRTELEAIYCIQTHDGVNIHVRNRGIIWSGRNEHGEDTYYFRAAPTFEAPADSPYAWLNNAIFVCTVVPYEGGVGLRIWKVQ